MTRLLVHVEGETEEAFVNDVLAPFLYDRGFTQVSARLVGNARLRRKRGGTRSWDGVKREICRHLLSDKEAVITTMVDYYGMPNSPHDGWPGRHSAPAQPPEKRAPFVEAELFKSVHSTIGRDATRFVPFVVMHEFEALLFSDCLTFCKATGYSGAHADLAKIRATVASPEEINDSYLTTPSRRILNAIPQYRKSLDGPTGAKAIGLTRIAGECPHFADWLARLALVAA